MLKLGNTRGERMAWHLQAGEYQEHYVTDNMIWQQLNFFFYNAKLTTTYKLGFFKALLDNLYETNEVGELPYDKLFYDFTKIYWNLVVHHGLWQSNSRNQQSAIQKILTEFQQSEQIPSDLRFDSLPLTMQNTLVQKVKKVGKKYVIGAFYGDTGKYFYSFHLKKEYLALNLPVQQFLKKHQSMLYTVVNYQLAEFLEKYNTSEAAQYLLTKVKAVSKRASLQNFRVLLEENNATQCFYCHKKLQQKHTHVDHFIPWSYVQNDALWNFVLACGTCNMQKNNRLAKPEYLEKIFERNTILMTNIDAQYFYGYAPKTMQEMYNYAQYSGYATGWEPKE